MKKVVGDTTDSSTHHTQSGPNNNSDERTPVPSTRKSIKNATPSIPKEDPNRVLFDFTAPSAPAPHTIRSLCGSDQPVTLQGAQITQLLRLKPELTEFLHLEIMNMKMGDVHMWWIYVGEVFVWLSVLNSKLRLWKILWFLDFICLNHVYFTAQTAATHMMYLPFEHIVHV